MINEQRLAGSGVALAEKIIVAKAYQSKTIQQQAIPSKPYAYIFSYKRLTDVEFLAALIKKGGKVRYAAKSFTLNSQTFDPGTLIITRRNNEVIADFDNTVQTTAKSFARNVNTTTTGFADKGADFGSGDVSFIKPPKIALLGGDQTSSLSHGSLWHFFEQQIHYPVSVIGTDYFKNIDLWKYTVLVVPDGNYKILDEGTLDMIQRWVNDGGKLIVLAGGLNSIADKKGFVLKEYATDDKKKRC